MKPLFELGVVIQPCTAAVASIEINVSVTATGTDVATALPGDGLLFPFTVNSLQAPLAASTLMVPLAVTVSTNSVKVAFWICAAVNPTGRCVRSN
jgi:hypothetical protein